MADETPPDNEGATRGPDDSRFKALASLAEVSRSFGEALPVETLPVETWNPPFCGDIDMRIAKDGTWFYHGSKIERPALVRLFSRLLRKDEERYVLVTPVECVGIKVEDVPFIAAELDAIADGGGRTLKFRTNVGDEVLANAEHPLRFESGTADGIIPYLRVRAKLWARLTRSLTLDLIARGSALDVDGRRMFGIVSGGAFFPIAPADDFE
jgi:uncharacterized protein